VSETTSERKTFRGPLPPIGARVRHYHPWLEDSAVGTVVRLELKQPWDRFYADGQWHNSYRIHLTDCMHWTSDGSWGPVPDTYFDNIAESWEYEDDATTGLETALPPRDTPAGAGPGARLDL
jgi:hypothetical protein